MSGICEWLVEDCATTRIQAANAPKIKRKMIRTGRRSTTQILPWRTASTDRPAIQGKVRGPPSWRQTARTSATDLRRLQLCRAADALPPAGRQHRPRLPRGPGLALILVRRLRDWDRR